MFSTDLLIGALMVCSIPRVYCDCCGDDTPVIDEQHFGKNNCCFFGYEKDVDINKLKESLPKVKKYGVACLPHHRLDFAYLTDTCTLTTAVPDNTKGEEIWGMAYVVAVADFNNYAVESITDCDTGERMMCSVTKTVKVKIGEETQSIKCNMFVAVKQPLKQTPLPMERRPPTYLKTTLVQTFQHVGIPQSYIDKVSQILTRDY